MITNLDFLENSLLICEVLLPFSSVRFVSIPLVVLSSINYCYTLIFNLGLISKALPKTFSSFIPTKLSQKEKNIINALLLKVEKYSNSLEELVKERTEQLEEERNRTETL